MSRKVGHHCDALDAGVSERHHRGERDMLGPDHNRPVADLHLVQIGELLQLAGGEDPNRSTSRYQPRGTRTLPASGGEEDGAGGPELLPKWGGADQVWRLIAPHLGHGRFGAQGHPRPGRFPHQGPRIAGPGHRPTQIFEPETGVVTVTWDPAR